MLEEWALGYQRKTGKLFNIKNCHIQYVNQHHTPKIKHLPFSRCLAHIVNLITQAMIKLQSKAKYYSPHEENQEDLDAGNSAERDELGLIQAICVKV